MGFIKNWQNAFGDWLEKDQKNTVHINQPDDPYGGAWQRGSYSAVGRPQDDFKQQSSYIGAKNTPYESRKAYDSLRRGEFVSGKNNNGSYKYEGGIYGTRFLGNSANDFMNQAYFSNNEIDETTYKPQTFQVYGDDMPKMGETWKVFYDSDGAIARVERYDNSKDEKYGRSYNGAKNISNMFKTFGWDSGKHTVVDGSDKYVIGSGGDGVRYTPTSVFGSGRRKKAGGEIARYSLENGPNKRAFNQYYSEANFNNPDY